MSLHLEHEAWHGWQLPAVSKANPVLHWQFAPVKEALGLQLAQAFGWFARHVAHWLLQKPQFPLESNTKPLLQVHWLLFRVAACLQDVHWLLAVPEQVEQVLWQFDPTQLPFPSRFVPALHVQVLVPELKVALGLQDKQLLLFAPPQVAQLLLQS